LYCAITNNDFGPVMKFSKTVRVYLALVLAMLFWGLSFVWYKQAYPEFKPITVVLLRLIISSVLLLVTAILLRKLQLPRINELKYFFLMAFFEPFLYFIGESYGMKYVSSSLASILIATIPLITPFVSYYFYREKLTIRNYLGIIISFLGVILVIYVEGQIGSAPWFGIMLMILAVLSTQGYAILLKKLTEKYNAISIICFQNLIGIIFFLPVFLLFESGSVNWSSYRLIDYVPVLNLAVFASTLAFLFFIEGIKTLGISKTVVFTNLIPLVTVVFAVFMLSEAVPVLKAVGIILTILGLFMSQGKGFLKSVFSGRWLKR
jgi:drug/metabolite transporter (DMT)-like permease